MIVNRLLTLLFVISLIFSPLVMADDLAPFKGEKGSIKISGGTAHIPVMKEVAKRIMRYNPDISISIAGGGSGVGIKQVGETLVDIGNSGRKPKDNEISKYDLKMYMWAVDGVGVVVNPKNGVSNLTKDQLIEIYSGKITNWSALGGDQKNINLYTRDEASGTRSVFWKKAISKGKISTKANMVASNGSMKTAISRDPYGIGYVSVGHIDESLKPIALDGIQPSLENVKSGKYKVSRGLYSNTKGEAKGLTKKLIHYLYTEQGQKVITEKGFIPTGK